MLDRSFTCAQLRRGARTSALLSVLVPGCPAIPRSDSRWQEPQPPLGRRFPLAAYIFNAPTWDAIRWPGASWAYITPACC